jgi:peroxiredoxin
MGTWGNPEETDEKVAGRKEKHRMALKVGDRAPWFCLKSQTKEQVCLSDYFGKRNVVLAFFPLAWTPV